MNENNEHHPNQAHEMSGEIRQESGQQAELRPRAVPNIPRREPDSLPERPEKSKSSGGSFVILLVLAVILLLVFVFWLKK